MGGLTCRWVGGSRGRGAFSIGGPIQLQCAAGSVWHGLRIHTVFLNTVPVDTIRDFYLSPAKGAIVRPTAKHRCRQGVRRRGWSRCACFKRHDWPHSHCLHGAGQRTSDVSTPPPQQTHRYTTAYRHTGITRNGVPNLYPRLLCELETRQWRAHHHPILL